MSGERTTEKTSRTRRIVFGALTWIVALLLVEAGVRVMRPDVGRPVYPGYPDGLVVPDDRLGHAYAPDFRGFFPNPRYAEIAIDTNSRGFRDVEWPAEPDAARPRVIVLGDSITFGSPLRREDRFTERAAAVLAERGTPMEICNLGVNGYNVEQYRRQLAVWGPTLKPRVVLIGYCLNDAEPMDRDDARRIANAEAVAAASSWARVVRFSRGHALDLGRSYAFDLGRRLLKQRMWASPDYAAKMTARYNEQTKRDLIALYTTGDGLARLRAELTAMRAFAERDLGARLAAVIFAYHHQLGDADPALSRRVAELMTELDIPHAELYDAFLPHAAEPDFYAYQDDCHPAEAGHAVAGEVTATLLSALLTD